MDWDIILLLKRNHNDNIIHRANAIANAKSNY